MDRFLKSKKGIYNLDKPEKIEKVSQSFENLSMNNGSNKIPWVEKYRPKEIKEVISQEEVIKSLATSIEKGQVFLKRFLIYFFMALQEQERHQL